MVSEKAKRQLREGLRTFQTPIRVEGRMTEAEFRACINEDKLSAVFIGGYAMSITPTWGGISTRIDIHYINREYSYDDIHIVTNMNALNSALCYAVGNYKQRTVFLAPRTLSVLGVLNKFLSRFGIFYANYTGFKTGSMESPLCDYPIFFLEHVYRIDRATLENMERETKKEVDRLAAQLFLPRMPDVAKVYLAHNYLATTVKYVLNERASSLELSYQQSAYGALIRKKCVCQGYAETFKMFSKTVFLCL